MEETHQVNKITEVQFSLTNPVSNDPDIWLIQTALKKFLKLEVTGFDCVLALMFVVRTNISFRGGFVYPWLFWHEDKAQSSV